jgi:hypothetical protein
MTKKTTPRIQPEGKLLLDDLWLNAAENALQHVARTCQRDVGHKPSLEDLRQLLCATLSVGLEDYFEDGATIDLTDIVFKTKKKPAAQRYKDGDVFAIPLGGGLHAFGRLIRTDKQVGTMIEVFRETSKRQAYRPSIITSGRMFHPVIASGLACLKAWRWTVVHSDPTYRLSKADAQLEFVYPKERREGWFAGNPFDHTQPHRPISAEEAQNMTDNALLGPEDVESLIREALKSREATGAKT